MAEGRAEQPHAPDPARATCGPRLIGRRTTTISGASARPHTLRPLSPCHRQAGAAARPLSKLSKRLQRRRGRTHRAARPPTSSERRAARRASGSSARCPAAWTPCSRLRRAEARRRRCARARRHRGRRADEHRDGARAQGAARRGRSGRGPDVVDRDHDDAVGVAALDEDAAAASASSPACIPPPTEKLGPVRPKAIEHSPGHRVRRRVRESAAARRRARPARGCAPRRARSSRGWRGRVPTTTPAPASGPLAASSAATAASARRTSRRRGARRSTACASARRQLLAGGSRSTMRRLRVRTRWRTRPRRAGLAARGRAPRWRLRTPTTSLSAVRGVPVRAPLEQARRRVGVELPLPRRRRKDAALDRVRHASSSSAPAAPSVCPICALNGCTTAPAAFSTPKRARERARLRRVVEGRRRGVRADEVDAWIARFRRAPPTRRARGRRPRDRAPSGGPRPTPRRSR